MNGTNSKNLIAIAVVALIGIGAGAWYVKSKKASDPAQVTTTSDAMTAASGAAAPAAPATEGEKKVSNFDLTVDGEGLSKAVATMTLEKGGVVKFRFYSNDAPNTVKRITQLISEGFYNGIIFHRVVPGFVVQAGDPTGTGGGGSGVKLKAEFNSRKHVPGILSMARTADPNSADSQFFVMLGTHPHLDNQYTVFGKAIEGFENIEKVQQGDKIKSFTIE